MVQVAVGTQQMGGFQPVGAQEQQQCLVLLWEEGATVDDDCLEGVVIDDEGVFL